MLGDWVEKRRGVPYLYCPTLKIQYLNETLVDLYLFLISLLSLYCEVHEGFESNGVLKCIIIQIMSIKYPPY